MSEKPSEEAMEAASKWMECDVKGEYEVVQRSLARAFDAFAAAVKHERERVTEPLGEP